MKSDKPIVYDPQAEVLVRRIDRILAHYTQARAMAVWYVLTALTFAFCIAMGLSALGYGARGIMMALYGP